MGLKDSIKQAIPVVFTPPVKAEKKTISSLLSSISKAKEQKESFVKEPRKVEQQPKTVFVPSKGYRKTKSGYICENCGKLDICIEVGKLFLCEDSCALKELKAYKNAPAERREPIEEHPAIAASIASFNPEKYEKTLAQEDTPLYAKGREELYYQFFNRDYDIDKMSDEELRDSIIADGSILFEVKVRQQKKIISLKERVAKRSEKEREKFRLDDLEYKPNLEEESILPKPKKSAKEKGIESLKALGLDASDMESLLKRFAKKEEKK